VASGLSQPVADVGLTGSGALGLSAELVSPCRSDELREEEAFIICTIQEWPLALLSHGSVRIDTLASVGGRARCHT